MYNGKLTANKKYETTTETIFSNIGFDSGSHYWEITIDAFVDLDDIYIGIAKSNISLYSPVTESGGFWGWIATGDRKFESSPAGKKITNYGGNSKIGDIIGVLLEFHHGMGSLSFYRNKVCLFCIYVFIDLPWKSV